MVYWSKNLKEELEGLLNKEYGSKYEVNLESSFIQLRTSSIYVHYEFLRGSSNFELHLECEKDKGPLWDNDFKIPIEDKLNELKDKTDIISFIQDTCSIKDTSSHCERYRYCYNKKPNGKIDASYIFDGFKVLIDIFGDTLIRYIKTTMDKDIETSLRLLKGKRNIILTGASGVGKTYSTAILALNILDVKDVAFDDHNAVMERYEELQPQNEKRNEPQIFFTTFHQFLDYEDFVEGLKPKLEKDSEDKVVGISYEVKDGIFKRACKAAEDKPVVLIIDEINRGNVSKIFGELITLIESDKRKGENHPLSAILPYSGEPFIVPKDLYIIGTMNTTDRSTGTLDYALRRRFAFVTLKSDVNVVEQHYTSNTDLKNNAVALFEDIKTFINDHHLGDYSIDDLMVGHSYFMAKDEEELKDKIKYEVIPLIKEYINDGILNVSIDEWENIHQKWENIKTAFPQTANNKTEQAKQKENQEE